MSEYPLYKFEIEFSIDSPARRLSGNFNDLVDIDDETVFTSQYADNDGTDRDLFIGYPVSERFQLSDGDHDTVVAGRDRGVLLENNPYVPPDDIDATMQYQYRQCVLDLLTLQGLNPLTAVPYGDGSFLDFVMDPSSSGTETQMERLRSIEKKADGFFLLRYERNGDDIVVVPYMVQSTMLDTFLISKGISALTVAYASCLESISIDKTGIIPYNKIIVNGPSELDPVTEKYIRPQATAIGSGGWNFPMVFQETIDQLPAWADTLQEYADLRLVDLNRPRYTFPVTLAGLIYAELFQPVTLTGFPLDIATAGGFRVTGVKWVNDEGGFFETVLTLSNAVIPGTSSAAFMDITGMSWNNEGKQTQLISGIARAALRCAPAHLIGKEQAMMCEVEETDTVTGVSTVNTHIGTTVKATTPYTQAEAISPGDRLLTIPVQGQMVSLPVVNAPVFGEYKPSSAGTDTDDIPYIDIYVPDHSDVNKRTLRVKMPNLDPTTLRDYEKIHAIPNGGTYYGTLAEPARAVIGTITEIDEVTGLAKATDLKDASKTYEEIIPYSEDMTWPT